MRRKNENKTLEVRLESWGDWLAEPVLGLGYPSTTAEYRIRMQKAKQKSSVKVLKGAQTVKAKQTVSVKPVVPEYSPSPINSKVHMIICMLPEDEQKALYARYVKRLKANEAVTFLNKSRKQYHILLNQARIYVAGALQLQLHDDVRGF